MALNIYTVIRRPLLTEKSVDRIDDLKKITFEVDPEANKPLVAEALEKLFGVKVKDVRIIVRKGKNRVFKRVKSRGSLSKRAIVTLKDEQSFDILKQLVTGGVAGKNATSSNIESARE